MDEVVDRRDKRLAWSARALTQNPVILKELRSRMRGRRAFVVLTVYLLAMSAFISLVYLAYASAARGPFGSDPRQAGKVVFATVLGLQVILVTFIGPSFTAGAVSGERERQTYDLLRTTLLTANAFITGKLASALSYVFLLIIASIPLQSIAFLLGGVSPIELLLWQALVFLAAVTFAIYGLYCSTALRTTLAASVATFAGTLFLTIGLPVIVVLFVAFLGSFLFGSSTSWPTEAVITYVGLMLAATNLPATLILGELFLLQEDTLFLFTSTMSGHTVTLYSPWPIFVLFYVVAALLLYWACVRRVRRITDR